MTKLELVKVSTNAKEDNYDNDVLLHGTKLLEEIVSP